MKDILRPKALHVHLFKRYVPMPESDGGADFSLVRLDGFDKPACRLHGAMNKVSDTPPGFWRCIATAGAKTNGCRAGCMEERDA